MAKTKKKAGAARKKPQPHGVDTSWMTYVNWSDDTPELLQSSTDHLWERILCGLSREAAERKFIFTEYLLHGPPEDIGIPPAVRLLRYCPYFMPRDVLVPLPGEERHLAQIRALYAKYDELCKGEFDALRAEIQAVFVDAAAQNRFPGAIGDNAAALAKWKKETDPKVKYELTWRYYQWLRPYYYIEGIDQPHKELNPIERKVTFLGRQVGYGGHPLLVQLLAKAEELLGGMNPGTREAVAASLKTPPGGFWPRTQKERTRLSNHALGRAIDIDAKTNPMVMGTEAQALDRLLEFLKVKGRFGSEFLSQDIVKASTSAQTAESMFSKMKEMSDAIQKFLSDWLDKWKKVFLEEQRANYDNILKWDHEEASGLWKKHPDLAEEHRADREKAKTELFFALHDPNLNHMTQLVIDLGGFKWGRPIKDAQVKSALDKLEKFRVNGFISLPLALIVALQRAGAELKPELESKGGFERSGLEYKGHKDAMHFEVERKGSSKGRIFEGDRQPFSKAVF
jgi:hypothetical protein